MNNKLSYSSKVVGDALLITVPSPKKLSAIAFLMFWAVIWIFLGGILASQELLREIGRGEIEKVLFLSIWIIGWVIGVVLSIYHLLWQIVGKEEIEITPNSIAIRQVILGFGQPKRYSGVLISDMRVDAAGRQEPYPRSSEGGISISKGTGMIAFNYKKETIRMGIGINEAEAKELVTEIMRQYPQYKNE